MPAGRKPHAPTKHTREVVKGHTLAGTSQAIIAGILEIDLKTLRKHYRAELDHSVAVSNADVAKTLLAKAKAGDTVAMLFWLKTRAGWKEARDEPQKPDDVAKVLAGVLKALPG